MFNNIFFNKLTTSYVLISHYLFFSKVDEQSEEDKLGFLIPTHEYFHQSFCWTDCILELFRNSSKGLDGGFYFIATMLNRKDVKVKHGKHSYDEFEDFFRLFSDALFCNFFIEKHSLDINQDNTPPTLKGSDKSNKLNYLHNLVAESLKEMLPCFKNCKMSDDLLVDYPLALGKRQHVYQSQSSTEKMKKPTLMTSCAIDSNLAIATVNQIQTQTQTPSQTHVKEHKKKKVLKGKKTYLCDICNAEFKYESICNVHIKTCLINQTVRFKDDFYENKTEVNKSDQDMFWNYNCGQFFMLSLFMLSTIFEKWGDGLGMFLLCKIQLPIYHGLGHCNYSTTIHRFISRVLSEATPREAYRMIHERFVNRTGKPGGNIFKDKAMEYRIGALKKLIANLGPNFGEQSVQQINKVVDIKEELFNFTRLSHGISVRSGNHNPRSDLADFELIMKVLKDHTAHTKVNGRSFGKFDLSEDLIKSGKFDDGKFYKWITEKNAEFSQSVKAKTTKL